MSWKATLLHSFFYLLDKGYEESCQCPAIEKADSKEQVLCSALCRFIHK